MLKPKTTISGRLGNSSGEWIRCPYGVLTTDLRVMREKPDFGNFDRITLQISQLYVLRFRRPKQSAVGYKYSYSISFTRGSQVLFRHFSAFSFGFQSLKWHAKFCHRNPGFVGHFLQIYAVGFLFHCKSFHNHSNPIHSLQ
jgi:hypothetical protein